MLDDKQAQREHFEILRGVLHDEGHFATLRDKIDTFHIFKAEEHLTIWELAQSHYATCRSLPTKRHMQLAINIFKDDNDVPRYNKLALLVNRLYEDVTPQEPKYLSGLMKKYMERTATLSLSKAIHLSDYETLKATTDTLYNVLNTDPILAPKVIDPYSDIDYNLISTPRDKTGIEPIDLITEGTGLGEVVGIIMPSGGGKTTSALQIAKHRVREKKGVVYFAFEQGWRGDIAQRWCTISTDSSRSEWNNGWVKADPILREAYMLERGLDDKYFRYIEMMDPKYTIKSIHELFQIVQGLMVPDKDGYTFAPHTVIIDWWGRMRNKLVASNTFRSEQDRRYKQQEWMGDIKDFTTKFGIHTILYNQLSGDAASKKKTVATQNDAQEDKNWGNMLDICLVAGRKDSDSCYDIVTDKIRNAGNGKARVFLDGSKCKLELAEDEFGGEDYSDGNQKKVSKAPAFGAASTFLPDSF